jgi:hypothetical protein
VKRDLRRWWPWLLAPALLALWASRLPSPGASARATDPTPAPPLAPSPAPPSAVPRSSTPLRNVFEYMPTEPAAPPAVPPPPLPRVPRLQPASPSPVMPVVSGPRLVGIVRRGTELRAALSLRGETAVLAVGESLDGYTVLAVDDEAGVRLRGPGGEEITLPPPS